MRGSADYGKYRPEGLRPGWPSFAPRPPCASASRAEGLTSRRTPKSGAVLNCTIDKYAYASLDVRADGSRRTRAHSLDYNFSLDYGPHTEFIYDGRLDLVTAALRVLRPNGGQKGSTDSLELFLHSDAPPGTGLGGSSSMCVALVGAFQLYLREWWSHYEIAELAYRIERRELGVQGGRQDQYASAFGGFNFIEFGRDRVTVHPLRVPQRCSTSSPSASSSATPERATSPTTSSNGRRRATRRAARRPSKRSIGRSSSHSR